MMVMRFGEYLTGLTPDAQRALADDLTLGAGRAALAARRHTHGRARPRDAGDDRRRLRRAALSRPGAR